MNKLSSLLVLAIGAVMAFTSCDNKKQSGPIEFIDPVSEFNPRAKFITIYGICERGTMGDTLRVLTDNGDTISYNISKAKEDSQIFGGYAPGDRMAVILDGTDGPVVEVINESSLLGNWLTPNPIDGSSDVGISIKDGGIAESIDQSSIIYKTWKLNRGQLEILLVREGGGDEEETNLYSILKLDADSLILADEEDTFDYRREGATASAATEILE